MPYERLKCPQCELSFGQEKRFLEHLSSIHGTDDPLRYYLDLRCGGTNPTCQCSPDCTVVLPWAGWKKGFTSRFARGHNARLDSVYLDADRQKRFVEKRLEGYASGRLKAWNDGLTKETDERVALSAQHISDTLRTAHASGQLRNWHADQPEKALRAAARSSETKRARYASGETVSWNLGLTKETDPRLAASAAKVAACYEAREAGRRVTVGELLDRVAAHVDRFELLSSPEGYLTRRVNRLSFRCTACGETQLKSLAMLEETPVCFACHPKDSKGQLELYDFVRSLSPDALLSDRTVIPPKELDVFVPGTRLGIEYDGLYWHSTQRQSDDGRSDRKMKACRAMGLRFMVVYEDEWRDKRAIVEGMLRHRLGFHDRTLHARKCTVRRLSSAEARSFFEANHLDGYVSSAVSYGLLDDVGVIVAAAALRRPFHAGYNDALELSRSCPLLGTVTRGWLGKLTRALCDHARAEGKRRVITYVDGRIGTGTGYAKAGWQLLKADTGPRFWWTDGLHRYDRFKHRADKARGMTQQQVADEAGVVPIFGCSNSLWEIRL